MIDSFFLGRRFFEDLSWQPWFERYVYGTEIPVLPKVDG